VSCVEVVADVFAGGGFPDGDSTASRCAGVSDVNRMIPAWFVFVGDDVQLCSGDGVGVVREPFACASWVGGGAEPHAVEAVCVFLAFDYPDWFLADDCALDFGEAVEDSGGVAEPVGPFAFGCEALLPELLVGCAHDSKQRFVVRVGVQVVGVVNGCGFFGDADVLVGEVQCLEDCGGAAAGMTVQHDVLAVTEAYGERRVAVLMRWALGLDAAVTSGEAFPCLVEAFFDEVEAGSHQKSYASAGNGAGG
jgi:hypothetical protein